MRIGRNLTVQEVYNIVNKYNSTYELTETQINEIIAHAEGSIGCLSQILGVDSNLVPVTMLKSSGLTVHSGGTHYLAWDIVYQDNLEALDSEDNRYLNPPFSGIYSLAVSVYWDIQAAGYRDLALSGWCFPDVRSLVQGRANWGICQVAAGEVYLKYGEPVCMHIVQNSGADIAISTAKLLLVRRSICPALIPE